MNKNPYVFFENYLLRAPLFSFSSYKKLTSNKVISNEQFKKIFENPIFKEALFLSSPALSSELNRFLKNELDEPKKIEKLKTSLLKYISRMSSRCTPFGILAGCSIGSFSDETNIQLEDLKNYKRQTKLDMDFLVDLSQDLAKNEKIKEQIHFFPNTSIYKIGNQLRYVEYKYINRRRKHYISEVDCDEYLEGVLLKAKDGVLLNDLVMSLVDDEITIGEARSFIDELINNQILVSDLEPSVSGLEFLDQICDILDSLKGIDDIYSVLKSVQNKLKKLDDNLPNSIDVYLDIYNDLKKIKGEFELKYLFQTDMLLSYKKNTLDNALMNNLSKAFLILNKLSIQSVNPSLNSFKETFAKRYEEKSMPLASVLDVETGIGYKQNNNSGDISPLTENIILPNNKTEKSTRDLKWSKSDSLFQKKIIKAYRDNEYVVNVTSEELKNFNETWENLPDTMSFIVQVLLIDGEEKIVFKGGGGSSGANLLGRFCHLDEKINTHTQEIIDVESQINKDKIMAEIVHLPESRVGNILMRPSFRKHEIPYLAKSMKNQSNQLSIEDLEISVKRKKVLLKSKKVNKEVIPRLTNAHNFSMNSLPIYNFLCDMQTAGKQVGVGLALRHLDNEFDFLPRIEYENIIIKEARWNLTKDNLKDILKNKDNDEELYYSVIKLRKKINLPKYVLLVEDDNKLIINLNNINSVRMFLATVKRKQKFSLIEFLHSDTGIVKKDKKYYTNEFIVSCYNNKKLKEAENYAN